MNAEEFKTQLLNVFYQDMHAVQQNNYSYRRYSYDGVDRSQLFDIGKHVTFMSWFGKYYAELFTAWGRLADQRSRDLYIDLIRYKLAGHLHVRIRTAVADMQAEAQRFRDAFPGTPSAVSLSGLFGAVRHYDGVWNGEHYVVDTVPDGLVYTAVYRQYYFQRDGIAIMPQPGDHVVDAGAFTGDSAARFSMSVGAAGRVYSFDPVEKHLEICRLNAAQQEHQNITLFPYGVGEVTVDAPTVEVSEYTPGYRPSSEESVLPLVRIDDLVIDRRIERIDFLKMDVEGSEMAALRGAEASIRKFRPKLALSIYHKPTDFFQIIDFVHGLGLGYRLFIDQHTIYDEETVLYAAVA